MADLNIVSIRCLYNAFYCAFDILRQSGYLMIFEDTSNLFIGSLPQILRPFIRPMAVNFAVQKLWHPNFLTKMF